ncbi:MAG: hypothetical protein C0510_08820 [Erythrobacter sp.]|nr:hypothetical protein [Erythrobacter sp.]
MRAMRFRLTVMALAALLGGCKADATRDGSDRRGAEGEVLGGTISDAMIPLEKIQSQSPALRAASPTADGSGEEGEEEAADGEGDPADAPAPQVPPVPPADPAG